MFFDLDDIQHRVRLRWCRQAPVTPGKLLHVAQIPALIWSEMSAARRSRATFVCSDYDRRHLRALGFPRLAVVPNAVTSPAAMPALAKDPVLLFVGSAGHPPNAEAATRMVTKIFPLIEAVVPGATLLIAGPESEALPCRTQASPRVRFLGFVHDFARIYAQSRVFVCPMDNGGGTRIKIIDAAAYGVPVVSTAMGAEGLDFVHGRSILIADSNAEFASFCIDLMQSDKKSLDLRNAAASEMRTRYDSAIVEDRLHEMIELTMRLKSSRLATARSA